MAEREITKRHLIISSSEVLVHMSESTVRTANRVGLYVPLVCIDRELDPGIDTD